MHLLIIEDNVSDVTLLKELLSEHLNAPSADWAKDGVEALDYLKRNHPYQDAKRPDLILLDLGMPRLDGKEFLQALKQGPELSSIPVIVLSTSRNPTDREQVMQLGAAGYLSKPHNLGEYEALIQQLLNHDLPRLMKQSA